MRQTLIFKQFLERAIFGYIICEDLENRTALKKTSKLAAMSFYRHRRSNQSPVTSLKYLKPWYLWLAASCCFTMIWQKPPKELYSLMRTVGETKFPKFDSYIIFDNEAKYFAQNAMMSPSPLLQSPILNFGSYDEITVRLLYNEKNI